MYIKIVTANDTVRFFECESYQITRSPEHNQYQLLLNQERADSTVLWFDVGAGVNMYLLNNDGKTIDHTKF